MGNQQLQNLTNSQIQCLLTDKFGDGHLTTPKTQLSNSLYKTSCIYKEYLEYKKFLLGDLSKSLIKTKDLIGFHGSHNKKIIYELSTISNNKVTDIYRLSMQEGIDKLDDLGIALWFYDDGSLHKSKYFYNLNTQYFTRKEQEELFLPFFAKYNIYPKITVENKKDGNKYYYLRIGKFDGSFEITSILLKYRVKCYDYKIWSSETIQKWSKLQEKLKSTNMTSMQKGKFLQHTTI